MTRYETAAVEARIADVCVWAADNLDLAEHVRDIAHVVVTARTRRDRYLELRRAALNPQERPS